MTILWLDDQPESTTYERGLIKTKDIKIINFELIDELLEYLESNAMERDNTLFVIDVFLKNEDIVSYREIFLPVRDIQAGIDLFDHVLDKYFPNIPVILYTSIPEHSHLFNHIHKNSRFNKDLFLVSKIKFEKVINIINKLKDI